MTWKPIGMRADEVRWLVIIAVLMFLMAAIMGAQDTRQVTEPKIPASCTQLAAGAPPAVFPAPQRPAPRGGCRPFISINDAKDVGIMGDGVIDGRGYAKLLGKDYSWWEMARKAEPKNERYFTTRMIVANHAD